MVQSRALAARFDAFGDWRKRLASGISTLHTWLKQQDLADAQIDLKIQQLLTRLHEDKLTVAFVAEFSRGKSELINAIFFADFGQRLLPTTAGRTTIARPNSSTTGRGRRRSGCCRSRRGSGTRRSTNSGTTPMSGSRSLSICRPPTS